MPEPRVIDVRNGLNQEVLDDLRRAERVVLIPKGDRSAALGYWLGADDLRIAVLRMDGLPWIRVPQAMPLLFPSGQVVRPRHRFVRGVLMDIQDPQHDEFWGRLMGFLRAGDVLRLAADQVHGRRPVLRVSNGQTVLAQVDLPRRARPSASSAA